MATEPRTSSRLKFGANTRIGTWNTQGKLSAKQARNILISDLEKHQLDICSLQETRMGEHHSKTENGGIIIGIAPDNKLPKHQQYGQGFYISKQWAPYFWGTKSFSNRISAITFLVNDPNRRRSQLTIINVYAPTSIRIAQNANEAQQFYDQLQTAIAFYSTKSLVIITGDFNAKLGQRQHLEESIIGKYGNGSRNESGHLLANFLEEHALYVTNTTFQQKASRRTTWIGKIRNKMVFNQIDYIIISQATLLRRNIIKSSRSYEDLDFQSDHKLVITKFNLSLLYIQPLRQQKQKLPKYDTNLLSSDPWKQIEYQNLIQKHLPSDSQPIQGSPNEQIHTINEIFHKIASEVIPLETTTKNINDPYKDTTISSLSKLRSKLNRRIKATKSAKKNRSLRQRRNRIANQIKHCIHQLNYEKIESIAQELEENKGNRKCFMAAKSLQNQSKSQFTLLDSNNNNLSSPESMLPVITKYYEDFYNKEGADSIDPWTDSPAAPLDPPISPSQKQ